MRREPDDRPERGAKRRAEGRKVRTPQGSAPGNARSGQLEGQWHRKHTAPMATLKGSPHTVARGFQARDRSKGEKVWEERTAPVATRVAGKTPHGARPNRKATRRSMRRGKQGWPVRRLRAGRLASPGMATLEEWSSSVVARMSDGGHRIRLTAHCEIFYEHISGDSI